MNCLKAFREACKNLVASVVIVTNFCRYFQFNKIYDSQF